MKNLRKKTSDPLAEILRRGDPEARQSEIRPADERAAALLAQCAAELNHSPTLVAAAPKTVTRRHAFEKRWAMPVIGGAIAVSAAVCAVALRGPFVAPARITPSSPIAEKGQPPSASPVLPPRGENRKGAGNSSHLITPPKKVLPMLPGLPKTPAGTQASVSVRPISPIIPPHRSDRVLGDILAPKNKETESVTVVSQKPTPRGTASAKIKVREAEPIRTIIVLDDTPSRAAEPAPVSVAIRMDQTSESVIVSRPASAVPTADTPPATN